MRTGLALHTLDGSRMALALAWSRSFADAHDVGMDSSVTSESPIGDLEPRLTPFVLCPDDEYMSLLDIAEADSRADQSPKAYPAVVRPVWSESELDHNLGNIKTQLLEQEGSKKNGKASLQGTPLWATAKADRLVEAIRQSTEALVWGERHDAALFDLFCEHHMLAAFVIALRALIPSQVKVQILQTISILVQNARRTTSFFFLLSGGQLNILFDDPPDLEDEEILTYFVTFLKSLALRLDGASACLCLAAATDPGQVEAGGQEKKKEALRRLPIFDCAVKLVGHRDSMVQTAARTALLSLLRIEDPLVRGAAGRATALLLAPCLANIVSTAHLMVQLDHDASRLQDAHEELEDWLGFIGDLFELGIPELSDALTQRGFSAGENGVGAMSADAQSEYAGLAHDVGGVREGGLLRQIAAAILPDSVTSSAIDTPSNSISASDRLEAVVKHYSEKEVLPFPYELKSPENIAVIMSSLASPLVPQREVRHAVTKTIQTIFSAEELCLEHGTKAGNEALNLLERRLADALQPHARNSLATSVLRATVTAWAEVAWDAINRHSQPTLDTINRHSEDVSPLTAAPYKESRRKRYHIYCYALMSEIPFEKLATDNLKKATTMLHYNTMMGRTAVMYDQFTGRSTFKRDKRGNAYILKAIHTAHDEYPCEGRGDDGDLEHAA